MAWLWVSEVPGKILVTAIAWCWICFSFKTFFLFFKCRNILCCRWSRRVQDYQCSRICTSQTWPPASVDAHTSCWVCSEFLWHLLMVNSFSFTDAMYIPLQRRYSTDLKLDSQVVKAAEEAAERCSDHVNRYPSLYGQFLELKMYIWVMLT